LREGSLSVELCMSSRDLPSPDLLDRMVREALQAQFAGVKPSSRVWRRIRREAMRCGSRPRPRGAMEWASALFALRSEGPSIGREELLLARFGLGLFLFPDVVTLMTLRFGW